MLRKKNQSYLDMIFDLIQQAKSPRDILIILFKHYLLKDPSLFSPKTYSGLVNEMLQILMDTNSTDEQAVKNTIIKLSNAGVMKPTINDNDLLHLLNSFFSVYQHYIFEMTTHEQVFQANPFTSQLKTKKNVWMEKYPHRLQRYKNGIYSLAACNEQTYQDLFFLKDCINATTRQTIINNLLLRLSHKNFLVIKHACTALGSLGKFIPVEQRVSIVITLKDKLIADNDPQPVLLAACKALGKLVDFIPDELDNDVKQYLLKKFKYANHFTFKLAAMETFSLYMLKKPDPKLLHEFFILALDLLIVENFEDLDMCCGIFVALRKYIPETLRQQIVNRLISLLDFLETQKYACSALAQLADIVPALNYSVIIDKLFDYLHSQIYRHAAHALVAYKGSINPIKLNHEIQVLIDNLCNNESEDTALLINLLSHLHPCMQEVHRKQFCNELRLRLDQSELFIKLNCCKALATLGDTIPPFFVSGILNKLIFLFKTQEFLRKDICIVLGRMRNCLEAENICSIIELLLNCLNQQCGSLSVLICETLPLFFNERTSVKLQKTLIMKLCRHLYSTDIKEAACQALLTLIPSFSPDMQILLLGQVADKNNELADKIFIFCNHIRSKRITSQHRENQLFFALHVRDAAHYARCFGI